jgi:hypothetical protein
MEGRGVGHNLKGTHPRTIPARFDVIWFSGFRGEDLNVIFYQNIPNLHNRYKSAEQLKKFLFLETAAILNGDGSWVRPFEKLCPIAPPSIQDGCCY